MIQHQQKYEEVALGSVLGSIVGGGTPSKNNTSYWNNGTIPWCSVKDMSYGKYQLHETQDKISLEGLENSASNLIPKGTVIIATRMGLGRAFINKVDFSINQDLKALFPNNKIIKEFLLWSIIVKNEEIESLGSGATVKGIRLETLKAIKIPLPPLPTQQKIAQILSAYDDLIENNLKRIKLLEEMAQITYEQWFVRMKFPNHETTPIDAETGLPEGWAKKSLSHLTSYVNRGIAPKYVEEEGFIVINQKCIRDQYVNFNVARLTSSKKKIDKNKLLQQYDILVNSTGTGTLGRVAQIMGNPEKATVDTHVTIVRANKNISALYLGRALELLQPLIVSLGKGATNQQELGRFDLANIVQILVPPAELQAQYEKMVSPIFQFTSKQRKQNQLLKEARDILLPRLMTGIIDVDKIKLPKPLPAD